MIEFNFIYWILLVFSGVMWLVLWLTPIAVMTTVDDNSEVSLYSIPTSLLFSSFGFVASIHLFTFSTSYIVWLILVGLSLLNHIILIIVKKEKFNAHYIISLSLTLLISSIPFIIKNTPNSMESQLYLDFNKSYHLIITIFATIIISFCFWIYNFKIKRSNEVLFEELKHIQDNIYSSNHYNSILEEPYTKYLREEISLLSKNNSNMSSILSSVYKNQDEINKSLELLRKQMSYNSNKSNYRKMNKMTEDIHIQDIYEELVDIKHSIFNYEVSSLPINPVNTIDIIRELNHFIATPLSSIIANSEIILMLHSDKAGIDEYLGRIKDSVELCRCVLATYREIATVTGKSEDVVSSIEKSIIAAFKMYRVQNKKYTLNIDVDLPDSVENYSSHYIISIILPLIENAVVASPDEDNLDIRCLFTKEGTSYIVEIYNYFLDKPDLKNLKTQGYSSKENHKGSGLMIVRHLVQSKKGKLDIDIYENSILFKITLPQIQYQ